MNQEELRELAECVALYMSTLEEAWTVGPAFDWQGNHRIALCGPNGEKLLFKLHQQDKKRVYVTGLYPSYGRRTSPLAHHYFFNKERPEITCAVDRGGRAIANDIKRRLLEDYRRHLPEIQRLVEKYETMDEEITKVARAIAQALGVPECNIRWNHDGNVTARPKIWCQDLDVEIRSLMSIQIELHRATPELALEVAGLVREHQKGAQ